MTFSRLIAWTLFMTLGFGVPNRSLVAQDQPLPSFDFTASEALRVYRDPDTRGIPTAELPEARKQFRAYANYFGEMVKHPLVYKHAQDPSVKAPDPISKLPNQKTVPPLEGPGSIFTELQRCLVEPTPSSATRVNKDRGDYIRELGIAFDAVLKPIINENPETIVRINATRMLGTVAKTGATAFYPTITELLKNGNTPPAIKYYALVAAANLLSAYDVYDYASRRHSNGWKNQQKKGEGDRELAQLVMEIEKHVTDPAAILNNVPNFKVAEATTDQQEVIRFIRRQAVRALGEFRFVSIPSPDGKSMLYPAYTLARVCVSDPSLGVVPSPSECGEAAIGVCNMSRIREGEIQKDYDPDAAAEAVTAALVSFVERRASSDKDRSLDWRGYGLRLSEAFKTWPKLFDFGFNPLKPNNFTGKIEPPIDNLVQRMQTALIAPLEKGDRVAIEDMKAFLKSQRARKDRKPLFNANPATSLDPPVKK